MMIDHFFNIFLRTLWYTVMFIFWVGKAFFVTIARMSNSRR